MPTRPVLSLKESALTVEKKVADGSHDVFFVTFKDVDGTEKRGYKKPCIDDYYPPLLAKYVVAISTLIRAALGEKASEDRLVYNDAGEIVATVSIEVPNFIPLLTYWKKYDDLKKEKIGCPTKQMLIDENVAELLLSAYIHKNNDLHPSNMSIYGIIDLDEYYYDRIKSKLVGERPLSGVLFDSPTVLCELKEQDLRIFPIVDRIHWPANYIPKNWNLAKAYKTGAFAELQGDSKFIYQYFTAILKELLAFDKTMLEQRMKLCLGDEPLALDNISPKKRAALLGNSPKLFLDDQENERGFVEHSMLLFEEEHNKFKKMVLNMPEFREFLIIVNKNPAIILNIKKWFINQNKTNIVPYNLNFVDIELHSLWLECFKQKFADDMKQFDIHIRLWTKTSPFNNSHDQQLELSYEQLDALIQSFVKHNDIDESKTGVVCSKVLKPEKTSSLNNHIFLKIKAQANHIFENISHLITQYQEKIDATINDNHIFIENIKKEIAKNISEKAEFNTWITEYLSKPDIEDEIKFILNDHIYNMNVLYSYIEKFVKKIETTLDTFQMNHAIVPVFPLVSNKHSDHPDELKKQAPFENSILVDDAKSSPFLALAKICNKDELNFIHTESTIIFYLSMLLERWVIPNNDALIKKLIKEAYTQDYDGRSKGMIMGTFSYFFKTHGEEVYNMTLPEIFSSGKWTSTSLNTMIIKKLCITLLEKEKHDPYLQSMYKRITASDDTWWSTVALEIAEKSNLKNPCNASARTSTLATNAH